MAAWPDVSCFFFAQRLEVLEVLLQRRGLGHHGLEGGLLEDQHGDGRDGLDGELPVVLRLQQRLVAVVVAVRQHLEHRRLAVLAGADPVHLAVGDEDDGVRLLAGLGDDVTGLELLLLEAVGQRGEHLHVLVAAQQRQLAELLRDDLHLRAGAGEGDAAVAHRVAQAAVDAVRAAGHLHPRQQLEQPPRGDALHLRVGLGRRRQLARRLPSRGSAAASRITIRIHWIRHDSLTVSLQEEEHDHSHDIHPRTCWR